MVALLVQSVPAMETWPEGVRSLVEAARASTTALIRELGVRLVEEGSPEERIYLARFLAAMVPIVRCVPPASGWRGLVEHELDRLISLELTEASAARRLSLRLLQSAVETYGVFVDVSAWVLDALAPQEANAATGLVAATASGDASSWPPELVTIVRFQLAIVMCDHLLADPGSDTALHAWARMAASEGRAVRALLVRPHGPLGGLAVARLRARMAMGDWDAEDRAHELEPWPG